MTFRDRLALASRIAACLVAGSVAGFVAWTILALGLGSLIWAAPLIVVVALFFGLPSVGVVLALGLVFARSIRNHDAAWCLGLPTAALLAWRVYTPSGHFPPDGTMLIAACAISSSALFFAWSRYLLPVSARA